jgi:hypothetical protein
MTMAPITKKEYTELKEYYDYQRKIQYNRERCEKMAEEFEGRIAMPEVGMLSENEIFNIMWNKVKPSDYDDPPKDWVPNYDNLRFEWELDPKTEKQLPKPKGKKVVVKAKEKWDDYIEELNDNINDDYNIQK